MQDSKFMSAAEKERVLKAWKRFVKAVAGGDREKMMRAFTKALYNHLIQHCSFIAHFNRHGFFDTYFTEPERTAKFFTQFDEEKGCVSVEYGMTFWIRGGNDVSAEYYDINGAMVEAAAPYLQGIYLRTQKDQEVMDLHRARQLLEKHGRKLQI